ncbi:MAG TPA: hypothetical protein VF992_06520 [Thermoplasmata archaeon]
MAWLLEEDQPSVRYLALTQLLERPEDDPDASGAKEAIPRKGWAADILAAQRPGGFWINDESLYRPKYLSTNWMLLILSDLGLTKEEPRTRAACELWIERFAKDDGGFSMDGAKASHLCVVGNTARALVKFGYADHPKVRSALEWLVQHRDKNGGWSCFGSGRNLDSWEGMSAFAAYPREKWTEGMKRAVEDAAEFYLQRELHKQGSRYEPWYRFHYPIHYYYDILVGLDFMTSLGYGADPRMRAAVSLLKEKRRADGRWNLDAVHPDLDAKVAKWYTKGLPTPFALEKPGEPSKMVTLRAMLVLKRLGESI